MRPDVTQVFRRLSFLIAVVVLCQNSFGFQTDGLTSKRRSALRTTESISIDGRLNEGAWSDAQTAGGFLQVEPNEN